MAQVVDRFWAPPTERTGLPRRDRKGCRYAPYIPDNLIARDFIFYAKEAADVADAERAIARLNERAHTLGDTEELARLLLRAESVASSKIEGLEVGPRRLLRADAARQLGVHSADVTAAEVLANIEAMTSALDAVTQSKRITVESLLDAHRRLLAPTSNAHLGGVVRRLQNWIGGSAYNPCTAAFVPPPPELVDDLLDDLCAFCNEDSLPTVAQAAIAHAQFETVHPFVDGNGRVGRALIHMIFRRRGLTTVVTPPVSLVLATLSSDYIDGLMNTRYVGPMDSKKAHAGINSWISTFSAACSRAAHDADAFETTIHLIQKNWRLRLGNVRAKSAAALLIERLPGAPIVTVRTAATLLDRSVQAANEAVTRLQAAGILTPLQIAKRERAFEARDIIDAFTDLERQPASPRGDTKVAPPTRPVPYRARKRSGP